MGAERATKARTRGGNGEAHRRWEYWVRKERMQSTRATRGHLLARPQTLPPRSCRRTRRRRCRDRLLLLARTLVARRARARRRRAATACAAGEAELGLAAEPRVDALHLGRDDGLCCRAQERRRCVGERRRGRGRRDVELGRCRARGERCGRRDGRVVVGAAREDGDERVVVLCRDAERAERLVGPGEVLAVLRARARGERGSERARGEEEGRKEGEKRRRTLQVK